jgi:hypothetical protein
MNEKKKGGKKTAVWDERDKKRGKKRKRKKNIFQG